MKMTTTVLTGILLLAAAPSFGAPAAKPAAKPKAARVAVGGVKAASVALADFAEHLRGARPEEDLRPWIKALAVVENYKVEISRDGAAWVVAFVPDLTDLREGGAVKGGARYSVDSSSYRIIEKTFVK